MKCPRCGSQKIEIVKYSDIKCILCYKCGFDERNEYEITPEERLTQKGKASFTPYKTGGRGRTRK